MVRTSRARHTARETNMHIRKPNMKMAALTTVIIAVCGTSVPVATAQTSAQDSALRTAKAERMDLRKSSFFKGASVRGESEETIGDISDLIIDRGSGRIEFVILRTGDVLGFGGETYVVPFDSIEYHTPSSSLMLHMTADELKQRPQFSKSEWKDAPTRSESAWYNKLMSSDMEDAQRQAREMERGERRTIKGKVTDVERQDDDGRELVIVTVKTDDGEQEVVLGQSWRVVSKGATPNRGQTVSYETVTTQDNTCVATTATANGKTMNLRPNTDRGWTPESATSVRGRFLLFSEVTGRSLECAGESCGTISDAVIERHSGRLLLAAVDPNENILGIGDELKLVPWSVISMPVEGAAHADTTSSKIVNSVTLPGGDEMPRSVLGVYNHFDADIPTLKRPGSDQKRAWRELNEAFTAGTPVQLDGVVVRTSTAKAHESMEDAQLLVVRTSEGEKEVVVGPKRFVKLKGIEFEEGDDVKVQGQRCKVNGKTLILVKTLTVGDKTVHVWKDGKPAWQTN